MVAQFAGSHGVRGQFKLRSFTDDPEAVFSYGPLVAPGGRVLVPRCIRKLKPGLFLCAADGIDGPEACAPFRGALLSVPRARLPEPDAPDDFYIADLVGLDARDPSGATIGTVRAVQDFGAGDVVEIATDGGPILVPFTRDAVPEIAIEAGYLTVIAATP